jgi:nitroreductase
MDVAEAIQKRRSVRRYKPDPVPEDVLDRLLDRVRLAPSAQNRQPWTFVVVRDEEQRAQVAAACHFDRPNGTTHTQAWIAEAPVIVVACGSEREAAAGHYAERTLLVASGRTFEERLDRAPGEYDSFCDVDLAIALDHLSLAAVEEGLGTCWIGGLNEPELKRCLSIPDDRTARLAMTVGYPVSWPGARPRKALGEVVCYERFS